MMPNTGSINSRKQMKNPIEIFQSSDGQVELDVSLKDETVWLTQSQLVELFKRDKSVISRHINNIFREEELDRESVVAKNATTAKDRKQYFVEYYNLDVIISVGYRIKSKRGVQFRQWATKTLNQHLVKGYTLNQQRLQNLGADVGQLMDLMQHTLQRHALVSPEGLQLTKLIGDYARSWTLLQAYDEQSLEEPESRSDQPIVLYQKEAISVIGQLKAELISCGEASELFGQLATNGLDSALGTIEQTFDGKPLYPTVSNRAAHLLYFIIKNHPFTDGNKRIGSFLFLYYLEKNKASLRLSGQPKISDNAMVPLALLIAESDPRQKELVIRLINHLLEDGNESKLENRTTLPK